VATKKDKSRKYIENIILNGSKTDRLALYNFTSEMSVEEIAKRFNLFVVGNFTRYYSDKPADFHEEMIKNYIRAYLGEIKYLNIGFRGSAKTTLLKLFLTYALLNDEDTFRKYIKVITKDTINSKQIVTDVYNLIVEVSWLYGDLFEKEGKTKKEESMTTFALKTGVKLGSGTVGQVQRGQVQDAYRPDFLWFEDIEDSSTIRSMVQTQNIISKIDEAIQGMSDEGSYVITANYISEEGTIQWFKNKKEIVTQITPIIDKDGKPTWDKYTPEKIKSLKDDAEDWEGDYMCDPTSGKDKFFDIEVVEAMLLTAQDPIREEEFVNYYGEYNPQHPYGIGGDTAEGVGRDSNALVLIDFRANTVEATFHSNEIAPDDFGYLMGRVGRAYGGCVVAPERNATGFATISALRQDEYPNIFVEVAEDKITRKRTDKLGWGTDRKTKPKMWFNFRKDFNDGVYRIKDRELLKEIRSYTKADFNDRTTGVITRHFDLLTSCVIASEMREFAEFNDNVDCHQFKQENYE
jgi:hypothetical protein